MDNYLDFSILKGIDNEFIFTIKKQYEMLPLVLTDTDTFNMYMKQLSDGKLVTEIDTSPGADGIIEIFDDSNGQIKLTLYKDFIDTLEIARGDRADNYYSKPMYELVFDCLTSNDGRIQFAVSNAYVR